MLSISSFSSELYSYIFNYLDKRDLLTCMQVSKRWTLLARDSSLWNKFFDTVWGDSYKSFLESAKFVYCLKNNKLNRRIFNQNLLIPKGYNPVKFFVLEDYFFQFSKSISQNNKGILAFASLNQPNQIIVTQSWLDTLDNIQYQVLDRSHFAFSFGRVILVINRFTGKAVKSKEVSNLVAYVGKGNSIYFVTSREKVIYKWLWEREEVISAFTFEKFKGRGRYLYIHGEKLLLAVGTELAASGEAKGSLLIWGINEENQLPKELKDIDIQHILFKSNEKYLFINANGLLTSYRSTNYVKTNLSISVSSAYKFECQENLVIIRSKKGVALYDVEKPIPEKMDYPQKLDLKKMSNQLIGLDLYGGIHQINCKTRTITPLICGNKKKKFARSFVASSKIVILVNNNIGILIPEMPNKNTKILSIGNKVIKKIKG